MLQFTIGAELCRILSFFLSDHENSMLKCFLYPEKVYSEHLTRNAIANSKDVVVKGVSSGIG